jgi:hypothetical protein
VKTARLSAGNQVVQTFHNVSKNVTGIGGGFAFNWWDEPFGAMQASAYNACMNWTDGGNACTGSHWLSSRPALA